MPANSHILAMHQPNYIPWLGYFYKMAQCDSFVFLDSVQFPRGRSFSARNRIKTPNGILFLTVPISIPDGRQGKVSYTEVAFADKSWKKKHLKTVEMSYRQAPYFEEVFELFAANLNREVGFVDLNIGMINSIAAYLGIEAKCLRLSELLASHRQKTDLIVDICKAVGASTYLSGRGGGKEYTEEDVLNKNSIQLIYSEFRSPVYSQLGGEFVNDLSVIDVLFNMGPQSSAYLAPPSP